MKNIFKLICLTLFSIGFLTGCEKDEVKDEFLGGTAPVLTSSTDAIDLNFADADKIALSLDWTNPNYNFTSGRSSQNVIYNLEIDTVGANFTNPKKQVVAFTGDLGVDLTVAQINGYMLNQMELSVEQSHNLEIRIVATVNGAKATQLVSNIITATATPYKTPPKVTPPATGDLWMLGDATFAGWGNPIVSPFDGSQKFTKISETLYEIVVDLPGGGGYKLIQENGVWGTQYHMLAGGTWEGGDLEMKDSDPQFPGPPSPGTYKITVDFQRGKFTAVKQ